MTPVDNGKQHISIPMNFLKMKHRNKGVYTIPGKVNDQNVDFLVSTAITASSGISSNLFKKFKLKPYNHQFERALSGDQSEPLKLSDIDIEIAGHRFNGVDTMMVRALPFRRSTFENGQPFEAVLGTKFLTKHEAVIDLKNKKLDIYV